MKIRVSWKKRAALLPNQLKIPAAHFFALQRGLRRGAGISSRFGFFGLLIALSVSLPAFGEGEDKGSTESGQQSDAASNRGRETGYPIPRFVSLKSSVINMRRGPGVTYPIDWVYGRFGLPMEVIGEFDIWLKVRAHDGTVGWMKGSLLDGRRMGLVQGGRIELYRRQEKTERGLVAVVDPGVIVRLHKCGPNWCRAEVGGYKGWLTRENLWGLYPGETFD